MSTNTVANRQAIAQKLIELAESDRQIVVLCSDSRGSGSMTAFAERFPEQFVEVGIAEQNLVSIAAGLAACGKRPIAVSPACFLAARSYEQVKIDCAYSNKNVKLLGISGGISYGALGMSHHSLQDIAAMSALPNMRVYLPSDRFQSAWLTEELMRDGLPAYIRIGRNAVEDLYSETFGGFEMDHAVKLRGGTDVVLVACGEMTAPAFHAAELLEKDGIGAAVLDMYCVKPLDTGAILEAAAPARLVVTLEEHSVYGGLGAQTAQLLGRNCPKRLLNLALPDAPVISGTSKEVLAFYGLSAERIAERVREALKCAE